MRHPAAAAKMHQIVHHKHLPHAAAQDAQAVNDVVQAIARRAHLRRRQRQQPLAQRSAQRVEHLDLPFGMACAHCLRRCRCCADRAADAGGYADVQQILARGGALLHRLFKSVLINHGRTDAPPCAHIIIIEQIVKGVRIRADLLHAVFNINQRQRVDLLFPQQRRGEVCGGIG